MTFYYNSTSQPESTFNEHQLELFYEAIQERFTGPTELMTYINESVWSDKDSYSWVMPDGHTVYIPVYDKEELTVELDEGCEFTYTYSVNKANNNHRHLVPNIIHAFDAYVARELVRRCDFEVATIHDSFWCSCSNLFTMKDTFKEIMIELAESNALNNVLKQINPNIDGFDKIDPTMHKKMHNSEYMLS